eukprot:Platyproteum_vivax@DN4156_c0_g1_i1.p1
MNFVAGMLLMVATNNDEEEAFWGLVCLMEFYDLKDFFRDHFPLLRLYVTEFESLLKEKLPRLYKHFRDEGLSVVVFLHSWFLTLFIGCFAPGAVVILWDHVLHKGLPFLLNISIAVLSVLEESLLELGFEMMLKFLKSLKKTKSREQAAKIGRLVVSKASGIRLPPAIEQRLWNYDVAELLEAAEHSNLQERRRMEDVEEDDGEGDAVGLLCRDGNWESSLTRNGAGQPENTQQSNISHHTRTRQSNATPLNDASTNPSINDGADSERPVVRRILQEGAAVAHEVHNNVMRWFSSSNNTSSIENDRSGLRGGAPAGSVAHRRQELQNQKTPDRRCIKMGPGREGDGGDRETECRDNVIVVKKAPTSAPKTNVTGWHACCAVTPEQHWDFRPSLRAQMSLCSSVGLRRQISSSEERGSVLSCLPERTVDTYEWRPELPPPPSAVPVQRVLHKSFSDEHVNLPEKIQQAWLRAEASEQGRRGLKSFCSVESDAEEDSCNHRRSIINSEAKPVTKHLESTTVTPPPFPPSFPPPFEEASLRSSSLDRDLPPHLSNYELQYPEVCYMTSQIGKKKKKKWLLKFNKKERRV